MKALTISDYSSYATYDGIKHFDCLEIIRAIGIVKISNQHPKMGFELMTS